MRHRFSYATWASVTLYGIINCIFVEKYLSRVTHLSPLVACTYFVLSLCAFYWLSTRDDSFFKVWMPYAVAAVFVVGAIVAMIFVSSETLNVDRGSHVQNFWQFVFNGRYPYFARSHLGNPSPHFPFYFISLLPFALLHEIGIAPVAAVLALELYLLITRAGDIGASQHRASTIFLVLACAAPGLWWEITARSTLIYNTTLVLIFCDMLIKVRAWTWGKTALYGAIAGALLCSRSVMILPIAASLTFILHRDGNARVVAQMLLVAGCAFVLLFLPFVLQWNNFITENPFQYQSLFTPWWYNAVALAIAAVMGYRVKTRLQLWHVCTLSLFAVVTGYAAMFIVKFGWTESIYDSALDISYFLITLPFVLFGISLLSRRNDLQKMNSSEASLSSTSA